jgi:dienelactone hydrolase
MIWHRNQTYVGANKRQSLFDVCYKPANHPLPIVIFAHGYKGFKDWGCWNLVAEMFADNGFMFVKFNFSHNGGTVDNPIDFPDLEAFANNRYSYEVFDLETMVELFANNSSYKHQLIDNKSINLVGHSRGGGIVLLCTALSEKIKAISTWAAVSDFESRFVSDVNKWKETGVFYVENGRTKQQMPHYYSFYEDFKQHKPQLDILKLLPTINNPAIINHGNEDVVVPSNEAALIDSRLVNSKLLLVPNANHTFGAKHPWEEQSLPSELYHVVQETITFFKQ